MLVPSPEYEAIRLASSARFGDDEGERLRALVGRELDWDRLFYEATYHGVQPVVYSRLRLLVEPDARVAGLERAIRLLHQHVSARTAYSLFLAAEMARLAGGLARESVPFLVLKGPSLADAYGGFARRPFVDNDLLIRRADFNRLGVVLESLGFHRRARTPLRLAGYLYIHGEFSFSRTLTGQVSTVDVHTAVVPPGLPYQERFETLLGRGRMVGVGGTDVPVLSWEDLLIALSLNGFKDQWYRLRLVADVAATARMVSDWDAVFQRTDAARSRRMLTVALLLAVREGGLVLPAPILSRIEADPAAVRLSEWTRQKIQISSSAGTLPWADRVRLNMRSQDSVTGRVRYALFSAVRRITEAYVDPEQAEVRRARSEAQSQSR